MRESYQGKVYNLKLGNAEETRSLGVDQTTMWANGILVGDVQVQGRHEVLQMHAEAASPDRLPVSWRTDYMSSVAPRGPAARRELTKSRFEHGAGGAGRTTKG